MSPTTKPSAKKTTKRTTKRAPKKHGSTRKPRRVYFVTGYPGFIGKRLVTALAEREASAKIYVLVQEKFEKDAKAYVAPLARKPGAAEVEILVGDIVDMDLGLSGEEYKRLVEEVTDIFHLAAIYYLGVHKEQARRVNVGGTRRMLEVAREMKRLRRFNHMSTAWVCGDREGVILEDELQMGQRHRNAYEETKYEAEVIVRDAMSELPITIYRPSIVVGDSKTGEIDRFDGPYYLGILLVTSPLAVPLPLPGNGNAPLNLVPVDYVVGAMLVVGDDPRGEGQTLHLVDPNPLSGRRIYEMIAELAGKRLPRVTLSFRLTDTLMRIPGLERLIRQQRQAVQYVNHLVIFNNHQALELLDGTGVRCPPISAYLPRLVDYVRQYYRSRPSGEADEVEDPLD
ncbi:MAG: SDR family oxidoreductase [Deltaproteobacteria bacterium]|nr:SDR family oxidoreductase [Deltaproteobacteria bacterium]